MVDVPIVWWSETEHSYFHIGQVMCRRCDEECIEFVLIRCNWYKKRAGLIEMLCMKCASMSLTKMYMVMTADWLSKFPAKLVSDRSELPFDALMCGLEPSGLSNRDGMNVWEAALDNSDSSVKIVDRTRLSGRVQSDLAIDVDEVRRQVVGRLEELERVLDADEFFTRVKNSKLLKHERVIGYDERKALE